MAVWHHQIVTGQSLAVGEQGGTPIISGAQANADLKMLAADGSLLPLEDPTYQRPALTIGARGHPGSTYKVTVNTHADGGKTYAQLKKGTAKYTEAISYATAGFSAAVGRGDTLDVLAQHVIHGEADAGAGTTRSAYLAALQEWLSDFDGDMRTITGQTAHVKQFVSQVGAYADNVIAYAQLDAHRAGFGSYCVGPRYQLPYSDGLHLTPAGYYWLGEMHGRVYRRVVVDGLPWEPVHPQSITMTGNVITCVFHVPTPPLVWDTTLYASVRNYGFGFRDDSGLTYSALPEITGANTVKVRVSPHPAGANPRLYVGALKGSNLRDSTTDTSAYDGSPLPHWCCNFDLPVSVSAAPPVLPNAGQRPIAIVL